jgi:hypothetical protein
VKTLIVAGTSLEADYWADQWKLDDKDWRFVYDVDQLKGVRDVDIKFCGNWFKRPDAKELRAEASWVERRNK